MILSTPTLVAIGIGEKHTLGADKSYERDREFYVLCIIIMTYFNFT